MSRALQLVAALAATALLGAWAAACGDGGPADSGRPQVVATHEILGAVARDLVGDRAEVAVLMPAGTDPHDFQPSAKDIERIRSADLVLANGLDLEEGLADALDGARQDGVPILRATDHVDLVRLNGAPDPHFWTDPAQMRRVAAALTDAAEAEVGLDLSARADALDRRLAELDAEIESLLAPIPAGRRKLVTGHDSLGYFARRYGMRVVGAVVPGLTSQARVSASGLADLKHTIARENVDVVFTEIGTPRGVVDAIAEETGAEVVELPSHTLPGGSYESLVRGIAQPIARALGE